MKQDSDEKLNHVLEALENPSAFTPDELKELFTDEECLKDARAILYGREALARRHAALPDVDKEWDTFIKRRKKKSIIPCLVGLSAVACLLLFFLIPSPAGKSEGLQVFEASHTAQVVQEETLNGETTITVPRGMQKHIKLPDGTSVILNADSRLSYNISQFGKKNRSVQLKGEGYFEVAKDSLHPFIVQSDETRTHVLGTVFNIKNYHTESMSVTLFSGSLKVASAQEKKNVWIKPGEQAVLKDKQEWCIAKTPQTADVASWTERNFYFDNQPLKEILCELGRWYNVNVIFKDTSRMDVRLHFKASRDESLTSVVELLGYICEDLAIIENNTIIVGK